MIGRILSEVVNTHITYEVHIDVSQANDLDEAKWMGEAAVDEIPDLEQDCEDVYKALKELWKDKGIKEAFKNRNKFQLIDSCKLSVFEKRYLIFLTHTIILNIFINQIFR